MWLGDNTSAKTVLYDSIDGSYVLLSDYQGGLKERLWIKILIPLHLVTYIRFLHGPSHPLPVQAADVIPD